MAKSKIIWTHKKYGKRQYKGAYGKEKTTGERCFLLSAKMKNNKMHNLAFESFQAAVDSGWKRA